MSEVHPKGWGEELWIVNSPLYCGKRFVVHKYRRCSLHYHKLKYETFFLESGKLLIELTAAGADGTPHGPLHELILTPGKSIRLSPFTLHRFTGLEDSVVFEFSTQHFEEDSYRLEDGDSQKKEV